MDSSSSSEKSPPPPFPIPTALAHSAAFSPHRSYETRLVASSAHSPSIFSRSLLEYLTLLPLVGNRLRQVRASGASPSYIPKSTARVDGTVGPATARHFHIYLPLEWSSKLKVGASNSLDNSLFMISQMAAIMVGPQYDTCLGHNAPGLCLKLISQLISAEFMLTIAVYRRKCCSMSCALPSKFPPRRMLIPLSAFRPRLRTTYRTIFRSMDQCM